MPTNEKIQDLGLKELRQLVEESKQRIEELEEDSRRKALEKMEKAAAAVGFTPMELLKHFGITRSGKKRKTVLYRNPDNEEETWGGRGRKPAWVKAWLEGGKSLDDLKVDKPES